jgi:hypothetical protein
MTASARFINPDGGVDAAAVLTLDMAPPRCVKGPVSILRFLSVLRFAEVRSSANQDDHPRYGAGFWGASDNVPRAARAVASSGIETSGRPRGGSPTSSETPGEAMTTARNEIDDETAAFANLDLVAGRLSPMGEA